MREMPSVWIASQHPAGPVKGRMLCHSLRRLIAVITQRHVIVKILAHLELETDPPPVQPARAPPQLELAF